MPNSATNVKARGDYVSGLDRIQNVVESRIAREFGRTARAIRGDVFVRALTRMIAQRSYDAAMDATITPFEVVVSEIVASYLAAGQDMAQRLRSQFGIETARFDITNPSVMRRMEQLNSVVRSAIEGGGDRVAFSALLDATARNGTPKYVAQQMANASGLNARYYAAAELYRSQLQAGSREALGRVLRDRRFDGIVSRSAAGVAQLTDKQIERMVGAYMSRLLNSHRDFIARTNALTATQAGFNDALEQMIAAGILREGQVERIWRTQGDDRVRDSHAAMDGQSRGVGTAFDGPSGAIAFPGDPTASVGDVAGCRCFLDFRVRR